MKITIKLFATLRKERFAVIVKEYKASLTVYQLIREMNIPEDQVTLIVVNNRHAELQRDLHDGDTVALFPPIGGG